MNVTDCSATARMRAPFFNGGLFDSMTLTRIVEPLAISRDVVRGMVENKAAERHTLGKALLGQAGR